MYNIKVYNKSGIASENLKYTLEIEKLENIGSFSSELWGGFWNLNISIAEKISNTSTEIGDIVQVQYKQDIIYEGFVLSIDKVYSSTKELVKLNLLGRASLLSLSLTNENYTDTASNIVKDLVDDFNTEYGSDILYYDTDSIPNSTGNISLDFSSYKNYLEAIKEVSDTSGLYFFVDLDGKVHFKPRSDFTSHTLTVGLDVDTITISEDSKELVNALVLKYKTGTKPYTDATSISTYGKREIYLDKSEELSNETTADIYGANYLATYKDKTKKVAIIVNNEYTFFDIKAGDLISVRNLEYEINDLQVARVNYWLDKATIELEVAYSFAKQVFIW